MLRDLSLDIICSSKRTVFLELGSRKTVRFSEQTMSAEEISRPIFAPIGAIVDMFSQVSHCLCGGNLQRTKPICSKRMRRLIIVDISLLGERYNSYVITLERWMLFLVFSYHSIVGLTHITLNLNCKAWMPYLIPGSFLRWRWTLVRVAALYAE